LKTTLNDRHLTVLYLVPVYTSSCGFFLEPTSNKLSCEQEPTCHHAIFKNSIGSLNFKEAQLLRPPYAIFLPAAFEVTRHGTSVCMERVLGEGLCTASLSAKLQTQNFSLQRIPKRPDRKTPNSGWTYARTAMKLGP
jgi:hypothetical protein